MTNGNFCFAKVNEELFLFLFMVVEPGGYKQTNKKKQPQNLFVLGALASDVLQFVF